MEDEQRWLKRLASTKKAVDQTETLEKDLFAQKREITALQKAVTDMREALVQERKINHKLYAENDKLRVSVLTWQTSYMIAQLPNAQQLCTMYVLMQINRVLVLVQ